MKNQRVTIAITSKDRHTECTLLLQSLRQQTHQEFDIILQDDASGLPVTQSGFLMPVVNRIKLEGHKVKIIRRDRSDGVCAARNNLIDEDDFHNPLTLRCDDDVILQPDYIERLVKIINKGYDMATGVVPLVAFPSVKREVKYVGKIICRHELDKDGNLVMNNDDLGFCYIEQAILPCDQFRTNCLYKTEIQQKVRYPPNLTTVGFREEGFFSLSAIILGYTIGVDVQAIALHLATSSGGVRRNDYSQCVALDDDSFKKWLREKFLLHGDFLNKYHKKVSKNVKN